MPPLVSILIITYNHGRFITEALESAIAQTYSEIEIVVSDDASGDGNQDKIAALHKRYPDRIIPLLGKEHVGTCANANRGLARCRGKYVAFLDGDDILLPTKVADQVQWLEERDTRVLCGHDVEAVDSESGAVLWRWSGQHPTGLTSGAGALGPLLHGGPYQTVATMVRSDALPSYGFDNHLLGMLDHKLWLDCLLSGGEYGFVPGVLARYRKHPDSLTARAGAETNIQLIFADLLITYTLIAVERPEWSRHCRRRRADVLAGGARMLVITGQPQLARRYVRAAMVERGRLRPYDLLTLGSTVAPQTLLQSTRRARQRVRAGLRTWRSQRSPRR
jgi:glycosyltransferase involved in cell wall biosynthesis